MKSFESMRIDKRANSWVLIELQFMPKFMEKHRQTISEAR